MGNIADIEARNVLSNLEHKKKYKPDKALCIDIEPETIDGEFVKQIIGYHQKKRLPRYKFLRSYYEGDNVNIAKRPSRNAYGADVIVADNRIQSGYARYIVTLYQGMLVGNPVMYSSDNEELMEYVQDILNLNDEQDKNSEIDKHCNIFGDGYEICYINRNADFRFNVIDPEEVIIGYNNDLNPDRIFAIRYYETLNPKNISGEKIRKAELYTSNYVRFFTCVDGEYIEDIDLRKEQVLGQVPVHKLVNNTEKMGSFEMVISLIDAIDTMLSDGLNSFEDDVDAFLVLGGMLNADEEDINRMRSDKTILLGENQSAEFLVKNITNQDTLNQAKVFDQLIHKFSNTIDITDENFASNMSGVAMKWKLFVMQQALASKQRKMKRFLQDRLRMIVDYINILTNKDFDYTDIQISFRDNLPVNEKEQVEMVKDLINIVSTSTALSQLTCVDDVQLELSKIEQENDSYYRVEELEDELIREEISEKEVRMLEALNKMDDESKAKAVNKIKALGDSYDE